MARVIRDIVVSPEAPLSDSVIWAKPSSDGNVELDMRIRGAWTPISSSSSSADIEIIPLADIDALFQ